MTFEWNSATKHFYLNSHMIILHWYWIRCQQCETLCCNISMSYETKPTVAFTNQFDVIHAIRLFRIYTTTNCVGSKINNLKVYLVDAFLFCRCRDLYYNGAITVIFHQAAFFLLINNVGAYVIFFCFVCATFSLQWKRLIFFVNYAHLDERKTAPFF